MGKTLRDVKRGDELLVSYKANYMHHTRVERQTLLKQLNIECHCEICQDAAENEPTVSFLPPAHLISIRQYCYEKKF